MKKSTCEACWADLTGKKKFIGGGRVGERTCLLCEKCYDLYAAGKLLLPYQTPVSLREDIKRWKAHARRVKNPELVKFLDRVEAMRTRHQIIQACIRTLVKEADL